MVKVVEKPVEEKKKKQLSPNQREMELIRAEISRLKDEELRDMEVRERYVSTHLWEFFKPFRWQERCLDSIRSRLTTLAPAPNKTGKTTLVAVVVMSWLRGYEAWNEVGVDYPGAVKVDGRYFRPSSLEIKPPVRIRITGEDWNVHLGQTVVPELKRWLPVEDFDLRNNTNGVPYLWVDRVSGSTLELLTHGMEDDLYESWRGHGWIPDEPPPERKFSGMSRGLFGQRGKILIPTTPLKQAWMLDKLVLSGRSDVGVLHDLCCLDNELYYGADDAILTEMGLSGVETKYWREQEGQKREFFDLIMYRDDNGVEAEGYLKSIIDESDYGKVMDLRFLKFAKDTPLDEKPSRFFGMFKKLVGLVVKEFSRDRHILPAFSGDLIPSNWIVTAMVDFHLGKPQAIAFYACSERNIHYVVDEVWENMSPEEVADVIIRRKRVSGWRIDEAFIDPLSKGDDKYMKNRGFDVEDAFTIIESRLDAEGITLEVASKDKKSGFTNIKSWLSGPNKIPVLYFLDSLQSVRDDDYGHVYEIQRLCYDDDGVIEKENDHFMECLYRYTLVGVEYRNRVDYYQEPVYAGTAGSWMGA